jgi:hypothetical protein
MTREQVQLFITKTPTHYRDLNPGPLVSSLDLRPLDQPSSYPIGVQKTRTINIILIGCQVNSV